MIIINHFEQGTKEWHDHRRGKITGTKLDDVMGTQLARIQLIAELIAEEGTEQSNIINPTQEMERGNAEEDFAIKLFEQQTGKTVERVGACQSDVYDWLMLSPDGLIRDSKGLYSEAIEIKAPKSQTAIFYRMVNMIPQDELKLPKSKTNILGIPQDYIWQVVNYFLVNENLKKLYFGVYDVRFIEDDKKLYIVEVERSNEILQDMIKQAEEALKLFRSDWLKYRDIISPNNF